ncbi:ABC transporter ATP-binding protein/permease [Hyphomicrobiales bacterium]|jgi:subfamily B ATP-binding cassette protein MsbA|nr:ABC transporter ATP-binding protein/permease [Hyphomicrobiales bacterium]|tara:strand:- start:25 stop:1791 length:1767 start_codon:yes stop_codon:yes gene_type:complete
MKETDKYYTFRTIGRIWKSYAKGSTKLLLIALSCNAIVALTTPALPELIRRVIDDIFVNADRSMLTILPLVALSIMLIRAIGTYGANVAINYIGQGIVGSLQKDLYKSILNSDLSYINSIHSARFISSFTADSSKLRETMSSVVVNLSRNILMVIGLVGYLFYVDATLATIFFIVIPPAAIGLKFLGKRLRKAIRMSLEEIGTLSALVSETIKGIRIIKAYGKEQIHIKKASTVIDRVVKFSMKGVRARSASAPIMEIVTGVAIACIIYYAGNKSLDGLMTVGSFMAFTTAAGLLYDPLKAVANLQAMLQEGIAASQRLFPILDNKPKINDKKDFKKLDKISGSISFENVSFSYSESENTVLNNISIEINSGQTVAFVGPSGAGKSSLLNLVPRFYDVSSGRVKIDGIDIKDLSLSDVRESSALVSQDTLIFDLSIRENIIFGNDYVTEDFFQKVCKDSLVDDFVKDLKLGYETVAGESGVRISGGQKQRIAIARAMIKNAPILLLDEATSSLDSDSEKKVQIALDALIKNKTALVIAHRLSTIRNVDIIYVIDQGKIVEKGNHASLIQQDGLYSFLFKTQFSENIVE